MTTNPKEIKKKLGEFRRLINRAKGLYGFGQIKTYRDALKEVGIENGNIGKYCTIPDDKIHFPTLHGIYEIIYQDYEKTLSTPPEVVSDDSILKHRDNLIQMFSDYHWVREQELAEEYKKSLNRELTLEEEYGITLPPENPKQKAKLFKPQLRAAIQIYKNLTQSEPHKWQEICGQDTATAELLIGQAGHGKTFVLGQIIRWLHDSGFMKGKYMTPFPVMYVTKASIVEQTERVLRDQFGLDTRGSDVWVTNYDSLRSGPGELFIEELTKVQDGVKYTEWKWKPLIRPMVFIMDENQSLKNLDSQQSRLFQSLNDVTDGLPLIQIFSSATPYTRTIEAKTFAVATRVRHNFGMSRPQLTNKHWINFATKISDPAKPIDYSPAAVARLTAHLEPFIVRIKGLRPKFHAKNQTVLINFLNAQEQKEYTEAWEEYQEQKAKIEGRENDNSYFCVLAALTIFRQKASLIRAPIIAKLTDRYIKEGKAVGIGVNFKPTIAKVVHILTSEYGYSRDQISLIWGGSAGYRGKEDLYTNEEISRIIMDAAMGKDIPKKVLREISEQIRASAAGLIDLPKELDLGTQSLRQRQVEIDKYQCGKSLAALFTFKAGGVGLSLHHTDELTEFKCRRTEAGWPVDEDIPKVPTRPRKGIFEPTYSAIEMVQALGRLPRLTSLSDTEQDMLFYRGTIEQQVAAICAAKFRCLKEVVQQRESWMDLFTKGRHEPLSIEGRDIKLLEEGRPPDNDEDDIDTSGIEGEDE